MIHRAILIVLFLLLTVSSRAGAEPQADPPAAESDATKTLIENVIQAYGGREALEKIRSVHAKGTIEAFMRGDHGIYERYWERDRKLRVETTYERSTEVRILNGSKGYRGADDASLEEVKDHRLISMIYQYKNLDFPLSLLSGGYAIRSGGKGSVNGKETEILHLADAEGPAIDIWIDSKDFFILRVSGYFDVGPTTTDLTAELADFRKVGDVILPFRIMNFGGGNRIAETVIKTYEINPGIPPGKLMTPR